MLMEDLHGPSAKDQGVNRTPSSCTFHRRIKATEAGIDFQVVLVVFVRLLTYQPRFFLSFEILRGALFYTGQIRIGSYRIRCWGA